DGRLARAIGAIRAAFPTAGRGRPRAPRNVTARRQARGRGAMLDDIRTGIDLALRLPGYLRRIIDLDQGTDLIRRRLERRAADFLALAREVIYDHPSSPYRSLLAAAGCELGDLERLVRDE